MEPVLISVTRIRIVDIMSRLLAGQFEFRMQAGERDFLFSETSGPVVDPTRISLE
jgi:hypothetical protein